MPISETKRKNNDKYNMKCDQILLKPLKPIGEKIRQTAKDSGKSLQGFILDAVSEYISKIEDGENIPDKVISNSMEWLKNHGHTDDEILDFLKCLSDRKM